MTNLKSIPKDKVQKIIDELEMKLDRIKEIANESTGRFNAYKAVGYAEGSIEHVLKQLKGEYPII